MAKHELKVELTEKQLDALEDFLEMTYDVFEDDDDLPRAARNALQALDCAVQNLKFDLEYDIEDECCVQCSDCE